MFTRRSLVPVFLLVLLFGSGCMLFRPSALMLVCRHGSNKDVILVKKLIDNGEKVNARDKEGITPLMTAIYLRKDKLARVLVILGADVHARSGVARSTPLHTAAAFGNAGLAAFLIKSGADVTAKDRVGHVPLIGAIYANDTEVVRTLLDLGADVNIKDDSKTTFLHIAARWSNFEIVKLLVDHGAEVRGRDESYKKSPLEHAGQRLEIVEFLISRGATYDE